MEAIDPDPLPSLRAGMSSRAQWREGIAVVSIIAAIAAIFYATVEASSLALLAGLVVVQGLLTVQAVMLFHDCLHFAAFRSPRLNTWVGRLIGGFFFWPLSFLRESHLSHHRYVGTVEKDTEALHLSYEDAERYPGGHLLQWLGRSGLGVLLYTPCIQALHFSRWTWSFLLRGERTRVRAFAIDLVFIAGYWVPLNIWLVARGDACKGFLLGFFVPGVLGMMAVYWVAKPLHTGMLARAPAELPMRERVLLTSRTFDAHPIICLLFCNLNFHIEHHFYPRVSRWELRALARELRPSLQEFARDKELPLIIHRSYSRWNRDFRSHGTRYNAVHTREEVSARNRIFEVSSC